MSAPRRKNYCWETQEDLCELADALQADGVRLTMVRYEAEHVQEPPFHPDRFVRTADFYGRSREGKMMSFSVINFMPALSSGMAPYVAVERRRVPAEYTSRLEKTLWEVLPHRFRS